MKSQKSPVHKYLVLPFIAVCLALGCTALWYREADSNVLAQTKAVAQPRSPQTKADRPAEVKQESPVKQEHGFSHAQDMSAAFRRAAHEALPGMVSIETQGHVAMRGAAERGNPLSDQVPEQFYNGRRAPAARVQGYASGFIIDRSGIIITSNHVIANADTVKVKLSDGREFIATDSKGDPRTDVAIVRIKPEGELHALKLGNSDEIDIGDWVLAVGSPFGLDLTVTAGIISAKGRGPGITEREDFLQTDAAINPGNSGGALVNLQGEVIAVNSAIATRSGGYEGIGFAVPINLARWVADQLTTHGAVTRAFLGVGVQAIDQELAQQLKIPFGTGVIVTHVAPDSPAAAARLEAGDVITHLNKSAVRSPRELMGMVEQLQIGHKYECDIVRDGKELRAEVVIKELPGEPRRKAAIDALGREPTQEQKVGDLGIEVGQLNREMAQELGYRDPKGVAIVSVEQGSVAAESGLQPGMMIDKVGTHRVATVAEFQAAIKDQSLDKGILLLIRTPRGSQFIALRKGK